ncbi:MAG TPA: cobyrinate a,c-diamide synthase [Nitrospirae bacterium]|nr:cobyrinic acid A,C-diamide synthase [bacterium BMS3Abin06]HDH11276.1 cobyrinate a,c-diamide synthase [Nitrospirota bacterium]HDY99890.1 cobyrinate a,c-diamide synthase [Nitrospirota bacterium]
MQGVVIAGTHSGCGKTTITLGILAALRKKNYKVQPFKTGPDFIDTGLHTLITGRNSRNLDLWMCGRDFVIDCFARHSADSDIAVVEGVMGMYDGNLSTADLAAALRLSVVLVVDAYGMAESAGAVVKGFVSYDAETRGRGEKSPLVSPIPGIVGVIFNRVASERHYKRLKESVRDVPVFGYLPRNPGFEIPHRYLGLVTAEEEPVSSEEIDKLADAVLEYVDVDSLLKSGSALLNVAQHSSTLSKGSIKIAVAYDKAFCFYYEDNLDLLRDAGAEIVKFSPLSDSKIPEGADALYIGGGYPELYAKELSDNKSMLESVKNFSDKRMPVYAECGGFMYITEGIYDLDNAFYPMAGAFPFKTKMTKGRARLGYREVVLKEDSIPGKKGSAIRGHEFHYSEIVDRAETNNWMSENYSVKNGSGEKIQDEGYRVKNTLGSYIHIHFGSNPSIAKNFVDFVKEHDEEDYSCRTRQS